MDFIFTIITNYSDFFARLLIIFSISLYFRFLLQLFGQTWITTTSHTTTIVFLPFVTFVITKVISGNIALSLGMVGALSIVRFRNPVRSPLELTVYFAAITMGIAASVNMKMLLFFAFGITFILFSLLLINLIFSKFFNKNFFTTSFSEGNSLSTIDIQTSDEIKFLDESDYLTVKNYQKGELNYVLTFANFSVLMDYEQKIKNLSQVVSYQINK